MSRGAIPRVLFLNATFFICCENSAISQNRENTKFHLTHWTLILRLIPAFSFMHARLNEIMPIKVSFYVRTVYRSIQNAEFDPCCKLAYFNEINLKSAKYSKRRTMWPSVGKNKKFTIWHLNIVFGVCHLKHISDSQWWFIVMLIANIFPFKTMEICVGREEKTRFQYINLFTIEYTRFSHYQTITYY